MLFRGVRLRLTLLYLFAAMALILLLGGGTYALVSNYFRTSTDLALQVRMAQELQLLGQPLPAELVSASRQWISSRVSPTVTVMAAPPIQPISGETQGDSEAEHESGEENEHENESEGVAHEILEADPYDGELAAIFALPLTSNGELISNPGAFGLPVAPDLAAAAAAVVHGRDLRTVEATDGAHVRLLSYPLNVPGGPPVLQLGRSLSDQDRVLNQLLTALLALGAISAVALTGASWWLAGRSLIPAEQAWEKQQVFVANASHELRAPLTLIRASAEVARRGLSEGDRPGELLGDILVEADHMSKLVDDLLLLSRLDAGQLRLERQRILMSDLLPEIVRQVKRVAEERRISLQQGETGGSALADPTRLRQVLLVLLDNAMAHTPDGGLVRLASHLEGKFVMLEVSDTGRGVPAEDLPRVFERFYRAEKGKGNGSGLGLAIAKSLVEAQNGQLRLESREGLGTKAIISLPSAER